MKRHLKTLGVMLGLVAIIAAMVGASYVIENFFQIAVCVMLVAVILTLIYRMIFEVVGS